MADDAEDRFVVEIDDESGMAISEPWDGVADDHHLREFVSEKERQYSTVYQKARIFDPETGLILAMWRRESPSFLS